MYEVGMVRAQGEAAKQASLELGILNTRVKNDILESMAEGLLAEEKPSWKPMPWIWKKAGREGCGIPSWTGCC